MTEKKNLKGIHFFTAGIIAFLTLGMDLFVMPLDGLIWGSSISLDSFFDNPWYMMIVHWTMVVCLWCLGGLLLFRWLKSRNAVNQVISFDRGEKRLLWLTAAAASILITLLESRIFGDSLPQILSEFRNFQKVHGAMALPVSLAQNIYYLVESMLVVLLLALMQRAGELWFKKESVPWGGIGLLLTWGLGHLTKGLFSCLWICGLCLVFGLLFVRAEKRWGPALLFMWLIFVI